MKRIITLFLACLAIPSLTFAQKLSELERDALKSHPAITSAEINVETAKWNADLLLAPFRPSVSLNAYATSGTGMPIFPGTVMPINYAGVGPDSFGMANIMLMWPLLYGDRQSSTKRLGSAQIIAAESTVSQLKANLTQEVRVALAEFLYNQEFLAATEADLEAALQAESDAKKRETAGSAPHAFTLRAQAAARQAESEVSKAKAKLAQSQSKLAQATNNRSDELSSASWDVELIAPSSLEASLQIAQKNRAEFDQIDAEISQMSLDAKIARQSELPELSFMAMGDLMTGSSTSFDQRYKFGLVLSIPIIDGKERRNMTRKSESKVNSLIAMKTDLNLAIRQQVESAWADWESSEEILKSATAGLESAEESYRVEQLRFQSGKSILTELLDAKQMLFFSRTSVADSIRFQRTAWANLIRAIQG
jgi:outer membrane protein